MDRPQDWHGEMFSDLVALRLEIDGRRELVPEPADPLKGESFADDNEEPPF